MIRKNRVPFSAFSLDKKESPKKKATAKSNTNKNTRKPKSSKTKSPASKAKKKTKSTTYQYKDRRHRGPRKKASLVQKDTNGKIPTIKDGVIRVIPVAGVEEIGRNMTIVQYKNEMVIIDAGIGFTDEANPGIDYLIPNINFLKENKDKIKGLVITHGHLDHIGAIPYIIDELGNPPIFSREFGALLIKKKAEEFKELPKLDMRIASKDEGAIAISENLKVRFFGLTHSIPDSTGVIIETPYGDIVSTGDVRVENNDGVPDKEEFEQYKIFKDRNVLLMTMDSTGITAPGWAPSEKKVVDTIDDITKGAPGRIIIATFASQVERIMSFIQIAKKYKRNVFIEGRSMKTNIAIARELDLTDMKHVLSIDQVGDFDPKKVMMIVTGGQGEEFAALARIANKTHRNISLSRTDTVILSSSVIPGNEGAVDKLKDNLYRSDATVLTYIDNTVHASGHGKREELKWIHNQIPYKFFMPVHGHHHRLKMHAELARTMGAKPENVVVPNNGSIIEITDKGKNIKMLKQHIPAEPFAVEGSKIKEIPEVVIRDRVMLAQDGIFVIIAIIDQKTGKLKKSPDLISRGFVYLKENQDLLKQVRSMIRKSITDKSQKRGGVDLDQIKSTLGEEISKFLYKKTSKRPLVIPVVLNV